MLKKLLLFIVLLTASFLNAQTFYWVGGSGNFNDANHWSLTSGGSSVNAIPNANSTIIFDNTSSVSNFSIFATQSLSFKSIIAQNTKFKVDFIGYQNADLTINGDVSLNEYFFLKLSGKLNLNPISSVKYQFSHNKLNNDVFVNANADVELGSFSTSKSLSLSGDFTLKNSYVFVNDFNLSSNTFNLSKVSIQSKTFNRQSNTIIAVNTNTPSTIITDKTRLSANDLNYLNSVSGLVLTPLSQCFPTGFGVSPTCAGVCDGKIVIDLSACTNPPFDLFINTQCGTPNISISGVPAASFTITNICGCVSAYPVSITNSIGENGGVLVGVTIPPPSNISFTSISPNCFGDCNGKLVLKPNFPTATPITAVWSNGVTHPGITGNDTLKNLCFGVYTVTTTNVNGCVETFSANLTQPTLLLANGSSSSVTCNGVCNGSATVVPSGGTAPYSYSWLSASSTPSTANTSTIGNLCPGVVTMTVTDSKTCTATYTANITQPPAITLTVTKTNLNCGNVCNGTASVTATGGIGGFLYSWAPSGGSGSQATGLCAGTYTCSVTNNGNCVKTITVTITSPPALTVTPTQQNILCNSASTGSVNLNPTGGTPNFSYAWSPAVSNTVTAVNLPAGSYNYTVTDALGCTSPGTVTITQPPAATLTISNTSVTCNGACDGTATGNMSGGTLPYTYSWTPAAPSSSLITNLCPNTYTLKVTDGNGCITTKTTSITQPTPISVVITSVSPTCNGQCNGSINVVPSGGTGPYTYTLQPTVGAAITTNPPFTNLCAGSYTLTVKDSKGCLKTQTINFTQPNPILLTLSSTPINCFNQCNATISTVVNGGTPAYTFTWSSGGSGSTLSNQCVGVHTATVTDSKGCQATASVSITSPPDLTVSITPTNPNCNAQCTGVLTTTVSGGTPNYSINWNNGASGNIINGLCQGIYTATVTDFFGCVKTQTASITTPPAITLTPTNGTVSCAGSCDGTVSVTPSGGTPGYFYNWNSVPSQTTSLASGLCVGNYVVNVTDALGCIASVAANVTQPVALTAFINNVQPSCNVCIGVATANGVGGTAPYTYTWSNGATTQTANNLCVGVQTVTVADSKGCISTQTVQINQTVITLITTNGNTLSCNGGCTGVATANPSGGSGGYTYTWTPAAPGAIQNTQTANGLCFGTHTVMVSDANGCSSTNTVTFTNPPAITLTVGQTNVSCNGACNGIATATATGGTGAISYLWQPGGATTSSINSLCAGAYTVTATDANNCSQTQVVTITEASSLTASFTFTNPSTCTSTNGAINATISGGVPAYNFTWTPPGSANINPLTNIGAGTYSLSIKDAAGCTQTIVTTLSNPTGPTVTAVSSSITCFGACNGAATLTIVGSGPFTVNGSAIAANTATLSGLCSGINTPVVIDANSCVTNQTVNIAEPTQLIANGIVSNLSCNSVCNGSINLTPSGGTPNYSYTWSPSGGSGQDPTNLCSGNYSVNIADANGCSITNTFVITQPSTLTLSFNKKDVLCNANCTGGVRAVIGGGTTPYTYTWTPFGAFPGSNIDTLVNLCSGNYSVTATDANGCSISGTINIGEPVALTSTITSVNVKCNGQCNGSAIINANGGVAPYTYDYNTTPITPTQTIGGLCVGTYTGNVTDANGCVSSNSFVITEPLPIVVTTTISNPKCNAVCNGSVATTVTGGNPNYSYNWIPNGGPVPSPTGLCAGNYTVVVTDDSLCTGQALVVLTDPIILISNISFTNSTCNLGCNGIATANPIGGTAPFSYSWASPVFTTQTISNLCAGSYTLTLTDANLCQDVQVVTLTDPPAIAVNPALTPATCGFSDGSINATAVNGVSPYTYNWLAPVPGAQSTNTLVTNLAAGVYTVIITDAATCSVSIAIPLSNADGPTGATITSTNVTCQGQCNGIAVVDNPVVGGTAPYTLSWLNSVPASTLITNLCAGTYTAQIADANNCLFFQSVAITQPQSIDDNEVIVSAACLGNCNGSIALNPSGGNAGAYTYSWSPAANTGTISNLCPGVYTATITDVMGCTLVANYNLPSITSITSSTFATNNTCFGNCNGTLLATNVAGGVPQYTYSWTDPIGQNTSLAVGLCSGNYSVTITDANGCFNVIPANVTSPSQVTFTPNVTAPSCDLCNGSALINPVGGTPGYTYLWSASNQTTSTVSNLCAGVYIVQITDGNGCVSSSNVIINSSSTITGETISFANVSCGGTCDGTVTVTAIGGNGTISYHWLHDGSTTQSLSGLCAGTYFCNMTDINGCSRTASVVIGAATDFTITPTVTQSSCLANTGAISVAVFGGTGTYTYAWLPAGNTATVSGLAPGIYTLTVNDGNCSQTQVYAINSINGPMLTAVKKDISCTGICDGSISLTISAGTPGYTTLWSNSSSTTSISGLCSGAYSVEVTDAAGCKAVQNFSLTTTSPIIFSAPDLDSPTCANNCNGSLTTIPIGGTLPYTYSWTPVAPAVSTINGLCAGNYSVIVTDANACPATESYTLINPPTLTLTATVTDASCNTALDGAITTTVSGGIIPYSYTWTPGPVSTSSLTNVLSGTYTLTLSDNFGCVIDSSFIINSVLTVNALAGRDTTFCQNGTLLLDGSNSNGGVSYDWFEVPLVAPIASTLITSVSPAVGTTTYVLVATNGACIDKDTIVVTSLALPVVDAGPMINMPVFSSTAIGGNPTGPSGSTFSWSPSTALDNPAATNPTSGTTVTTVYTVTVVDANGCSNSDTVTVFIYPEINVPNGFSPNGDGKNDVWQIDFIYQFPDCEVEVYNRWGERLFYSKGYAVPFNGQYKGKDLPVGTYYYVINLNHPAYPNAYTSPLTIFR